MLRRVKQYILRYSLLQPQDRVLVCVSGGADSVALLDVLWRAGYDCVVAHCNFHLRGEESNRDERFVRDYVASFAQRPGGQSLPLFVKDFDTRALAHERGKSVELMARELRYAWFGELALEQHCKAIAVAHHQNDQAETVLMNLRRSAGIRGLCGMRPLSQNPYPSCIVHQEPCTSAPIIRPLLCTTHDYILHYLRDIRHIAWVEDSTNVDTSIPRNAIRAMMASFSKADMEHIAATAERLQGYVDWLEGHTSLQREEVEQYEKQRHIPCVTLP